MKAKFFPYLCNLILFFSFFTVAAQIVFSQQNLIDRGKNYYSFTGEFEKIARLTRPRIYKTEKEEEKTAAPVSKPAIANTADLEHRVFDLVNQRRAEAGLPLLNWNDNVADVARVHSENMANNKFFSHTGVDGKRVSDRANSMGVKRWRSLGENIAYNRGFKSPLESAVQSWMNSSGHRDNILKSDWQESGIGVTVTADGTYYFTQVFLKK
jgi:uncharacterized protein YkwD